MIEIESSIAAASTSDSLPKPSHSPLHATVNCSMSSPINNPPLCYLAAKLNGCQQVLPVSVSLEEARKQGERFKRKVSNAKSLSDIKAEVQKEQGHLQTLLQMTQISRPNYFCAKPRTSDKQRQFRTSFLDICPGYFTDKDGEEYLNVFSKGERFWLYTYVYSPYSTDSERKIGSEYLPYLRFDLQFQVWYPLEDQAKAFCEAIEQSIGDHNHKENNITSSSLLREDKESAGSGNLFFFDVESCIQDLLDPIIINSHEDNFNRMNASNIMGNTDSDNRKARTNLTEFYIYLDNYRQRNFLLEDLPILPTLPLVYVFETMKIQPDESTLWLEFGVADGNTVNYIASFTDKKETVYGFDSWEGLPEDWRPGFPKGVFDRDGILPRVKPHVGLIKGLFDQTLDDFVAQELQNKSKKISFLHVDCDLYSSTKYVLTTLRDYIAEGCIIIFDEFINYEGYDREYGELRAFHEFLQENVVEYEWIGAYGTTDGTTIGWAHEAVALKIHRIAEKSGNQFEGTNSDINCNNNHFDNFE